MVLWTRCRLCEKVLDEFEKGYKYDLCESCQRALTSKEELSSTETSKLNQ